MSRAASSDVLSLLLAGLVLGGCVTAPPPLPTTAPLAAAPDRVEVPVDRLPAGLAAHPFRPEDGLDALEVAQLAVANNPDLVAARRRAGVARAQIFAAGLLPDPALALTGELPTGSDPSLTPAWSAELDWDLTRLVTRGAGLDAARASARQVDLEILWQEWQVAQQARTLFAKVRAEEDKLERVRRVRALFADRYDRSSTGLAQGNVTLDVAGTDLTALLDADSLESERARAWDKARHDLDALLGIAPGAPLRLVPSPPPEPPTDDEVRRALADLPSRRPDLLALKAGLDSEQARLREAALGRFPPVTVGVLAARDTSDVRTVGLALSVGLPFLDGGAGEVAVRRATRTQLRDEYEARLAATTGQVDLVRDQAALLAAQIARLRERLPTLARMVEQARRAYEAGDIGALTYLNMENTLLGKQLEVTDLEASLEEARIALDTLLGRPGVGSASTSP